MMRDANRVVSGPTTMQQMVEELRLFFTRNYQQIVIPAVESGLNKRFDQLSSEERRAITLGIVVGGFSHGAYLSEVWHISIPGGTGTDGTKEVSRGPGNFGGNWFAMPDSIRRYIKGYSIDSPNKL
jgi:hypothetical protein